MYRKCNKLPLKIQNFKTKPGKLHLKIKDIIFLLFWFVSFISFQNLSSETLLFSLKCTKNKNRK